MPTRIIFDIGDQLHISPPLYAGSETKLGVDPGDLSQFAPQGNGVYGYQDPKGRNPFTAAPPQEAHGGALYFNDRVTKEDFQALLRICGANPSKDYAIFTHESPSPRQDGYLRQMRLISKFGLRFMFNSLPEADYEKFPEQKVSMADALWLFIKHERDYWTGPRLEGLFGGDGYWAHEALSFGIMVENDYNSVFRIWSRAWLVTK